MIRGINRQTIFEEDADFEKFLQILSTCKEISRFRLIGYALLSNHVHLLLIIEQESLASVMRRIATRYAVYFNTKYERCGHLFQDRYRSEPVNDDRRLLGVLRYILQNPQKAGLEKGFGHYRWSSYHDYMRKDCSQSLTDTATALGMLSPDVGRQATLFKEFLKASNTETHMDDEDKRRPSDRECKEMIKSACGVDTTAGFQALLEEERTVVIGMLKAEGASIRQIARLTGMSFGVVRAR